MPKIYDVSAIGLASIDILTLISDEFLRELSFIKGDTHIVSEKKISQISKMFKNKLMSFGKTASNILAELATFGAKTHLISKVAGDLDGEKYIADLKKRKISYDEKQIIDKTFSRTLSRYIFITPDAINTAAITFENTARLELSDVDESVIARSRYLLIESCIFYIPGGKAVAKRACDLAKKHFTKVVFITSHRKYTGQHTKQVIDFIENRADVVFAGAHELGDLYDLIEFPKIIEKALTHTEGERIFSITLGQLGHVVVKNKKHYKITYPHVEKVVDKGGLDSAYTAGFLYALLSGKHIRECGKLGNQLSCDRIGSYGGRPKL